MKNKYIHFSPNWPLTLLIVYDLGIRTNMGFVLNYSNNCGNWWLLTTCLECWLHTLIQSTLYIHTHLISILYIKLTGVVVIIIMTFRDITMLWYWKKNTRVLSQKLKLTCFSWIDWPCLTGPALDVGNCAIFQFPEHCGGYVD